MRFDRAHLKSVSQEALEFDVVFHVLNPCYGTYMDRQQAILLGAMNMFEEMGVSTVGAAQHFLLERVARARAADCAGGPAAPAGPPSAGTPPG